MSMMLMFGVMFVLSVQPMMMILSLIFTILGYSIYLLWMMSSFWFSYMVVLVLMSGVLVVFTYMMSVLPNEGFEVSSLTLVVMSLVVFCKYSMFEEFVNDMSLGSMKIWVSVTLMISLFLVIYLLSMMVMIVWMSAMEKGAIRIS